MLPSTTHWPPLPLSDLKVLAGEKAFRKTGNWLPNETIEAYKKHLIGIPSAVTPVWGAPGFGFLNAVALALHCAGGGLALVQGWG